MRDESVRRPSRYDHGRFCWVDYLAHDLEAASRWYCELLGWDAEPRDLPGGSPHVVFRYHGKSVAGMSQMSDGLRSFGVTPMWIGFVSVGDIEATAAGVVEAGGTVTVPPMTVGDAGSLAVFADPDGAYFAGWKAGRHRGAERFDSAGAYGWNEYVTRNLPRARTFYEKVFGWSYREFPHEDFDFTLICPEGDHCMTKLETQPAGIDPRWVNYVTVGYGGRGGDVVKAKVRRMGGTNIILAPEKTGERIIVRDPYGGTFGLSGYGSIT